jgi:hypothetical protein
MTGAPAPPARLNSGSHTVDNSAPVYLRALFYLDDLTPEVVPPRETLSVLCRGLSEWSVGGVSVVSVVCRCFTELKGSTA